MPARRKHAPDTRTFTVRLPDPLLRTLQREARRLSYERDCHVSASDVVNLLIRRHLDSDPLPEDEEESPDADDPEDDPSDPANVYHPQKNFRRELRPSRYLPTPGQIRIRARQVRRTWNEQMRLKRRGIIGTTFDPRNGGLRNLPHWTPPELPHPTFED